MSLKRPAAGGESCKQDSFSLPLESTRLKDGLVNVIYLLFQIISGMTESLAAEQPWTANINFLRESGARQVHWCVFVPMAHPGSRSSFVMSRMRQKKCFVLLVRTVFEGSVFF